MMTVRERRVNQAGTEVRERSARTIPPGAELIGAAHSRESRVFRFSRGAPSERPMRAASEECGSDTGKPWHPVSYHSMKRL